LRFNIVLIAALTATQLAPAQVRLKDLGRFVSAGGVQLIGYGLVVGLDRSGDSPKSLFTNQALVNMLERFGIAVDGERVRAQNVAAVMVTANVPPYTRAGGKVDVLVSSIGDAKSLQGGVLLQTTLSDLEGGFWGVGSGPVNIGGFNIEAGMVSVRQNHSNVGRIPDGCILDRDVGTGLADSTRLTFSLRNGDFTTARRVAEAVNLRFGAEIARPLDAVSVEVAVPDSFSLVGKSVTFAAELENVSLVPDIAAKVVINERTGTIVIGEKVSLSTVAVSHGSLSITIKGAPMVSQPMAFSQGTTQTVPLQEITVEQQGTGMVTLPGATTVGDVATALNRLGVSPRDMVAIFQALKESGALQAELVVI